MGLGRVKLTFKANYNKEGSVLYEEVEGRREGGMERGREKRRETNTETE